MKRTTKKEELFYNTQFRWKLAWFFNSISDNLFMIYSYLIVVSVILGLIIMAAIELKIELNNNFPFPSNEINHIITFFEFIQPIPVIAYIICILLSIEIAFLTISFSKENFTPKQLFGYKILGILCGIFSPVLIMGGYSVYVISIMLFEIGKTLIDLIKQLVGFITLQILGYVGLGVLFIGLNILIMYLLYGRNGDKK